MCNKQVLIEMFLEDKARPNCAVVGVYGHPQASLIAYYALHAQQHRGQEAAGISTFYYDEVKKKMRYAYTRGEGLVLDVFSDSKIFSDVLIGSSAVGHNRYSTTGSSTRANIQPFNMTYHSGILSLAHNGNLTNTKSLRKKLIDEGTIFQTTTDSELFMHLIAHSRKTTHLEQIREALQIAHGAYSLVILTETSLFAARDPHGVRPLNIGRIKLDNNRYSYIVASETCAFDIVNAEYIRSVKHNEIIEIDNETLETGNIKSYKIIQDTPVAKHCIFEYIYFSRPDSKIFGHSVDKVRRKLGKYLALESPVPNDDNDKIFIIPVPDSANTAALGFAKKNSEQGYPSAFEIGLIRSHYVGRTFIAPGQDNREFKVKTKFNTVRGLIEGRHVVIVDDSIVRGTTSKALIKLIRDANPKKISMRIISPPIVSPCFYGMDFPSKEELIANHYSSEAEIAQAIGVDDLKYLSVSKLMETVPYDEGIDYCTACFTCQYPIPIEEEISKESNEN